MQEGLDEIEYVTGAADTKWGALRLRDGHPAPFALRYVEVGNEDSFDKAKTYDGRFAQFYKAIKTKYPGIQIIATMPVEDQQAVGAAFALFADAAGEPPRNDLLALGL